MNLNLYNYLNTDSPSGFEKETQDLWCELMENSLKGKTTFKKVTDHFGNASYLCGSFGEKAKVKILIASHVDEISWRISHVEDNGLIRVIRNGGTDQTVALGSTCKIYGRNIKGVFGQTAIHLRDRGNEKSPKVEDLYVDIGADNKDEVLNRISIGDVIVLDSKPIDLLKHRFTSKAIDNKIGGYILTNVASAIEDYLRDGVQIIFSNCIQEETGLIGSKMVADTIEYDYAIVTDVCHATDTPNINKATAGDIKLGGGAVLKRGSVLCEKLNGYIINGMSKSQYQLLASQNSSGTDADMFALSNGGKPTVLVKTPIRYMHTQTEVCDKLDVKSVEKIIKFLISKIIEN